MRPYVLTLKNEANSVPYDLKAVSNYYGSLNGGYYTACVKNQVTLKLYNIKDGSCSEMQIANDTVNYATYLLFFKKR